MTIISDKELEKRLLEIIGERPGIPERLQTATEIQMYTNLVERHQYILEQLTALFRDKETEKDRLLNAYAQIIAAVYDGERIEEVEPEVMAALTNKKGKEL